MDRKYRDDRKDFYDHYVKLFLFNMMVLKKFQIESFYGKFDDIFKVIVVYLFNIFLDDFFNVGIFCEGYVHNLRSTACVF